MRGRLWGTGLLVGALCGLGAGGAPASASPGVVQDGPVRFEVLTPSLVRVEYAADGRFEDAPTSLGFRRNALGARFRRTDDAGHVGLDTGQVRVSYARGSGPFTSANLSLQVRVAGANRAAAATWRTQSSTTPRPYQTGYSPEPDPDPSPRTAGNLGGWARGLDQNAGPRVLHDGLLSRDGYVFVDDSASALYLDGGRRLSPRPTRTGAYQDGYLFGAGRDYARTLFDYRALSGAAPLLPKRAFGVWFSRYAAYAEQDYRNKVLPAFRNENIPLDVLVVDTDFKGGHPWNGWTGWNRNLFPDPQRFAGFVHGAGADLLLNVHPSIASDDPAYPSAAATAGGLVPDQVGVARAFNRDPAGQYFAWDWSKPAHLKSFFDLHGPFERDGVDGWWLDWCCENSTVSVPGATGDTWINNQYALHQRDRGSRWPILSRMGASYQDWVADRPGPWGEQRSTIHFTGDTHATWDMLNFQTRFAAAEGGVGLPYVSNDTGSFFGQKLDPEMYVRWMQLGAVQPIFRIHALSALAARLPSEYEGAARRDAAEAFRLRESLVPYLYTAARRAVDTGLPIVRAMYLGWPEEDDAYRFDHQYMLGDDLLAAPVGTPGDPATKRVWFPPGTWIDVATGQRHTGPSAATLSVPLSRLPLFARAGRPIPRLPAADSISAVPAGRFDVDVYSGASGRSKLYDDAGAGLGYERGEGGRSSLRYDEAARRIVLGAQSGSWPGAPAQRSWTARVHDLDRPAGVAVDGRAVPVRYDAASRTLTVATGGRTASRATTITWRAGAAPRACRSRRQVTLVVRGGLRELRVRTTAGRARIVRVRGRRLVRVDLRGVARPRVVVVLTGRRADGRPVTLRRVLRTCAGRGRG